MDSCGGPEYPIRVNIEICSNEIRRSKYGKAATRIREYESICMKYVMKNDVVDITDYINHEN